MKQSIYLQENLAQKTFAKTSKYEYHGTRLMY